MCQFDTEVSAAAEIVFWTSILKLKQPQLRCGALKGPTHSGGDDVNKKPIKSQNQIKILKGSNSFWWVM